MIKLILLKRFVLIYFVLGEADWASIMSRTLYSLFFINSNVLLQAITSHAIAATYILKVVL